MTKKLFAALLLASLACLAPAVAHAGIVVQTLGNFSPYGIEGNNVVGTKNNLGYVYDGTTFKVIPNSSVAQGISGNKIVGSWGVLGFLYDGTNYTTLTYPGAKSTTPSAISDHNIVGGYVDALGMPHGFLYDGATWTTLNAPLGIKGTGATGISGNKIIGNYYDALGHSHGFLYDGTTWTTIDDPLSTGGDTSLAGISGDYIVGYGSEPVFSNGGQGFLYDGAAFTHPLKLSSFPGGTIDFIFRGMSGNKIVGSYGRIGGGGGFIATIPEPSALALAGLGVLVVAGRGLFARRRR